VTYLGPYDCYKYLIIPFSPSNVDIIDSYFYMSFLNVYYITLCRSHEKHLILNEVKNWQVCCSRMVTFVVVHYIADLSINLVYLWAVYQYIKKKVISKKKLF
jgi:hypothetical protein